ncbi:MAG: 2-hydroxyhepta-2,4-diene-1,7-dioate isomerase [Bacteroidetes bacterium 4572_112]|nr:MAG: 2-hydroxyhepta-2,4-diene-1,7-dioate isomerase [Bacteroidetes bacterium 4572_112]
MKIICIGRNYVNHAKELNNPVPEIPVWFMKPQTSLLTKNKDFFHPEFSQEIHFETELVYRINRVGKYIEEKFAHTYYDAIGIGFDFTARDLQSEFKAKGLPWEPAKSFDGSAPISEFIPIAEFNNLDKIEFSMNKNGEPTQQGISTDMIFSIDKIIAYVSQFVTLKIGDLIYTGTPAGVGPIEIGDTLQAYIGEKLMLTTKIK